MTPLHIVILLFSGAAVGFVSGLLGIGGGFLMTPLQYALFTSAGVPSDTAIKLAFGTNLLVILPTAISGAWQHTKKGAVRWRTAVIMGVSSMAVSFGAATLATHLPGVVLKMTFGAIIIISGIRLLMSGTPKVETEPVNSPWLWAVWSVPVGFFVGLIGFGGGGIAIPIMVLVLKFSMHMAVATSLAIMIFGSAGGVIGYIVNGLGVPGLPPYSIGYVNLPSWFLLAITSVVTAQLGAKTAHRLSAKWLRNIFIAMTFYVGLKMLGLFDWLGWPL